MLFRSGISAMEKSSLVIFLPSIGFAKEQVKISENRLLEIVSCSLDPASKASRELAPVGHWANPDTA